MNIFLEFSISRQDFRISNDEYQKILYWRLTFFVTGPKNPAAIIKLQKMAVALQPNAGLAFGSKRLDLEMIYEEAGDGGGGDDDNNIMDQSNGIIYDYDSENGVAGYDGSTMLMMKRSRSLPEDEFQYLTQKLKEGLELQRTDSTISGHSARFVHCIYI
jgi:hypothetical protein